MAHQSAVSTAVVAEVDFVSVEPNAGSSTTLKIRLPIDAVRVERDLGRHAHALGDQSSCPKDRALAGVDRFTSIGLLQAATVPPQPKTDKTTKNYHRKSPSRDARFYEERRPLRFASLSADNSRTSVYIFSSETSENQTTSTFKKALAPAAIVKPCSSSKIKRRSKCATWRDQVKGHGGHTKHFVASPWRDLSWLALVQEFADTLFEEGRAVAITGRLSSEIEVKVLAAPSSISYLEQRVQYQLRRSHRSGRLSKVPDFTFILEQIRGRETHLHGLVGASSADLAEIRLCFRLACGQWKTNRQHQVVTDEHPDDGWISYILKDRGKVLKLIRSMKLAAGDRMSVTFAGKPFTVTAGLRRRAQERYEQRRLASARRRRRS